MFLETPLVWKVLKPSFVCLILTVLNNRVFPHMPGLFVCFNHKWNFASFVFDVVLSQKIEQVCALGRPSPGRAWSVPLPYRRCEFWASGQAAVSFLHWFYPLVSKKVLCEETLDLADILLLIAPQNFLQDDRNQCLMQCFNLFFVKYAFLSKCLPVNLCILL